MCNYEGCATFDELISGTPVHTTMFGDVKALEMKRKWSIWQIPCPYAAMLKQTTGAALTLLLGNGIASGKIYELVRQQDNDDGAPIYPVYTSYGFVTAKQGQQLNLGAGRKLASYWTGNVQGTAWPDCGSTLTPWARLTRRPTRSPCGCRRTRRRTTSGGLRSAASGSSSRSRARETARADRDTWSAAG